MFSQYRDLAEMEMKHVQDVSKMLLLYKVTIDSFYFRNDDFNGGSLTSPRPNYLKRTSHVYGRF